VQALKDTPSYTNARSVPQISPLGSIHIYVIDPYEGTTNEKIMDITIPCGIILGSLGTVVAKSLRMMDQARASECNTAGAS